jgi:hypothetical protein
MGYMGGMGRGFDSHQLNCALSFSFSYFLIFLFSYFLICFFSYLLLFLFASFLICFFSYLLLFFFSFFPSFIPSYLYICIFHICIFAYFIYHIFKNATRMNNVHSVRKMFHRTAGNIKPSRCFLSVISVVRLGPDWLGFDLIGYN